MIYFLFIITGATNFQKFLAYTKTRKTRVLMLLHVSRVGLEKAGCANGMYTLCLWNFYYRNCHFNKETLIKLLIRV